MQKEMFVARAEPKESVNHPDHYKVGNMECIDAMLALYGKDAVLAFCQLNSFKYQWRCNRKDNCKEDLQKARWYMNKFLELIDDETIV